MIKCKRCKRNFCSVTAYGIHTWMVEKSGRKKICPSDERLINAGMGILSGQWLFLAEVENEG